MDEEHTQHGERPNSAPSQTNLQAVRPNSAPEHRHLQARHTTSPARSSTSSRRDQLPEERPHPRIDYFDYSEIECHQDRDYFDYQGLYQPDLEPDYQYDEQRDLLNQMGLGFRNTARGSPCARSVNNNNNEGQAQTGANQNSADKDNSSTANKPSNSTLNQPQESHQDNTHVN